MKDVENILILGAGLMQKPAILAAKKLGCRAVVVDGNPKAACVSLADDFYPVDLKDRKSLIELALKLKSCGGLKAVFTAGTDFSASVAAVAEKCGLPGHSLAAAENASDKTKMRSCFESYSVPSPEFKKLKSLDFADFSSEEKYTFPLVVKPVDNMGGRGCRMVRSKDELDFAAASAIRHSRSETAILEAYMDGPEYSIDSILYDGKLFITGFADRHIKYPPYFIEVGHTMPTESDRKKYCQLVSAFALGIKSLGLTRGAAKADIKFTEKGPMIGEIAARLSGGYMSGWTYPYASDCPLTEQALAVSCGFSADYLENHKIPLEFIPPADMKNAEQPFELYDVPCLRTSAERAWISIPGVIKSVEGLDEAAKVEYVKDVLPRVGAGACVNFPRNNVEKCGNIITAAPTRVQAVEAAQEAIRKITVTLMPNNPETDAFLAGFSESSEKGFPPSAYQLDEKAYAELEKFRSELTVIPADAPVKPLMPDFLNKVALSDAVDWNYCTIEQTLDRFDRLCPKHKKMDSYVFWKALIRGGIQGVLYVAAIE